MIMVNVSALFSDGTRVNIYAMYRKFAAICRCVSADGTIVVALIVIMKTRVVFFLMNIHNRFRTIYFARVGLAYRTQWRILCIDAQYQSGQSLIEHSYKADSDLSPAGWEYAERLKEFVLERRTKSLKQRGIDGTDRRLVVRICIR